MNDEEIVATLYARDPRSNLVGLKKRGLWYRPNANGYTANEHEAGRYTLDEAKKHEYLKGGSDEWVLVVQFSKPDYLNSLDAIRPVLETLTEEEKERLIFSLRGLRLVRSIKYIHCEWFFLTLPARELARCVAEVIKAKAI